MKRALEWFLGGSLGLLLWMAGNGYAADDGMAIVQAGNIPGRCNVQGRGLAYAPEAYRRLTAAGGEAYLLTFHWRYTYEASGQNRMANAVIFRDAQGRYWAQDAFMNKPVWVSSAKEPQKWLDQMYPKLVTEILSAKTEPKLAGQYADQSRKPVVASPVPGGEAPVTVNALNGQ